MELTNIHWLGQATFRIETGGRIIYIDPVWLQQTAPKADIILVTHFHPDHFSERAIRVLSNPLTKVYVPGGYASFLPVKPGDSFSIAPSLKIEVVPAYNIHKSFHPRQNHWVGYVIESEQTRIYHAGDTDLIPEMEQIKADIALVPIGGTYTMDYQEAAEAVKIIKPRAAIPMHYGSIVGTAREAQEFVKLCRHMGVQGEILKVEH